MGKTSNRETYRKEQEPRTKRRKIEKERANEVIIPSKQQLDKLLGSDPWKDVWSDLTEEQDLDYYPQD